MANEKVNTLQFTAMCEQLGGLTATRYEDVLEEEVGKVLETAIRYTKSASVQRIRKRYEEFVPLGMDGYSPRRVRRYQGTLGSNLVYYMKNRYPNDLWAALLARRVQLVNRKRGARGLAKKSWLDVAQQLGLTIEAPGYVSAATASTGKQYDDVTTSKKVSPERVVISFSNAQPTVNNIGGAGALERAMNGRVQYFQQNASRAVFADIEKIARAYPGLKIKP